MSYFDDNEDWIIYGNFRRGNNRNDPEYLFDDAEDERADGWIMENGEFILVEEADYEHLVNALGNLRRQRSSGPLAQAITEELGIRRRAVKPIVK